MLQAGNFTLLKPRLSTRPWLLRWTRRLVASIAQPREVARLLDRPWLLRDPATPVSWVREGTASFAVVRDDLAHPYLGGNKFRKLDGLWPHLQHATDVVTCGGLQSAHTTAVAAVCAEHGIRAHLLVRGERPAVPTGHHLYTRLLGNVVYVSRGDYADREGMLASYAEQLKLEGRGCGKAKRVVVIPEGAAQPEALLGTIRLVRWLATESELAGRQCHILVDSGTGATATGLALGAALLGLPWSVTGIMLASTASYYQQQQYSLVEAFAQQYSPACGASTLQEQVGAALSWVERAAPRKFGKVLPGEIASCTQVAQRHGIVLDPIWTLAAWEAAEALAASQGQETGQQDSAGSGAGDLGAVAPLETQGTVGSSSSRVVVMLHTGGMLGLCGLAQRFPEEF